MRVEGCAHLADDAVEVSHLRQNLLVVLADGGEARRLVVVLLRQQRQLRAVVLQLAPQLDELGALRLRARDAAARDGVVGARHVLGDGELVLQLVEHAVLLAERPLLLAQDLDVRRHVGGAAARRRRRRGGHGAFHGGGGGGGGGRRRRRRGAAARRRVHERHRRHGAHAARRARRRRRALWPRAGARRAAAGAGARRARRPHQALGRAAAGAGDAELEQLHLLLELLLLHVALPERQLELGDAVVLRELLVGAGAVRRDRLLADGLRREAVLDALHLDGVPAHLLLLREVRPLERDVRLAEGRNLVLQRLGRAHGFHRTAGGLRHICDRHSAVQSFCAQCSSGLLIARDVCRGRREFLPVGMRADSDLDSPRR